MHNSNDFSLFVNFLGCPLDLNYPCPHTEICVFLNGLVILVIRPNSDEKTVLSLGQIGSQLYLYVKTNT